jgi:uncharacterized protein
MNKLFVDTWGWLCMGDKKEKHHRKVCLFLDKFQKDKGQLFTSNSVLNETITLLFRRLPKEKAEQVMKHIIYQESLKKISITPERFQQAIELRRNYADQPKISLTDIQSFVIMNEFSISQVLTEDHHFDIPHFNFQRVP